MHLSITKRLISWSALLMWKQPNPRVTELPVDACYVTLFVWELCRTLRRSISTCFLLDSDFFTSWSSNSYTAILHFMHCMECIFSISSLNKRLSMHLSSLLENRGFTGVTSKRVPQSYWGAYFARLLLFS